VTRNEKLVLGGLGVVAVLCGAAGAKTSPGASWKLPERETEMWAPFAVPPARPVLGPDQHIGGYVYTPHRYPAACGNDITAAIHGGFSTMALPADGDSLWIGAAPPEDEL